MIRTRFSPSPTGFLHIGGLRTALFAYLFARQKNGKFILRIEDTDRNRFVEGSIEQIIKSLEWVGIEIDEGVELVQEHLKQKGKYGPYIQSKRLLLYQKYIQKLLASQHAYYCFCTKERLEKIRYIQEKNKQATRYDGHCRLLALDEAKKRIAAGEEYVVRLKIPTEGTTTFIDLVRGKISFENKQIDDQVLLKSDGFPTYHFAVVVDDHLMEITHVIRGEEWISSTPKHIILYKAFGWKLPVFVHLSLLVNEQKQKLSKRHGDVSLEDFRENGYLAEALVNFIAFLGWNPGDKREIFSMKKLEKEFTFDKVSKAPAVFNREKLDWYNKQYIMHMKADVLVDRAIPFFIQQSFVDPKSIVRDFLVQAVQLEQGRAVTMMDLIDSLGFLFASSLTIKPELLIWKKSTREDAKEKLKQTALFFETIGVGEWKKICLEEKTMAWIKEHTFGVGDVLWPVRVALSGKKNSPGPFEIASILGKDETIIRIHKASTLL